MDSQRFASTYQLKDIQDTYLKIYTEKTSKNIYWKKCILVEMKEEK